jgi:hypothetical protein
MVMKRLLIISILLAIALSIGCAARSDEEPLYEIGSISTDNYANKTLENLKRVFDPNGIISPGRYGIR